MASSDKVKVVVRVRPFNRREIDLGTKCVVDMEPDQTVLYHPSTGVKDSENHGSKKAPKTFAFDHCFWSMEETNPKFSSQAAVFNCLGRDVLERAFEGYNACIFAYGQTGSGKSYTMMGSLGNKGIIPRLCEGLFESIANNNDHEVSCKVEVSYMEIYNEKVRDLLDPKGKHNLRVREHNILGPYVDGLSTLAVSSFEDIDNLMSEGNKSRTVAATNMNSESSRSHAVFNIILTQTLTDQQSGVSGEKVSKMSLVDLAGSERAQKTGAVGERLKEGSNINKSLTTLGLVISALADSGSKNKQKFVPYRDSVLTWLLKDNLGGNSKTVMVATLSPAADNYEETLSTLRYADRAKRIVNHAIVNEDPNARIIRELREEVEALRKMLSEAQSAKPDDLKERLQESEKLMKDMGKTWEEKLKETERIHQERHATLEKMGISVQTSGIKVEQGKYYLVNLNADPSLNELLVYYLKEHTLVGRPDAPKEQDIQLSGLGIMSEHCIVDIMDLEVYITPLEGARTCANGCTITTQTKLKHGDRLLWGNNHFFRVNCPKSNSPTTETPENIDYDFAQAELMMQQMGNDPIQEAIESIEKQHEEDKQEALDKQRNMYERQMQMLRNQLMSPSTPSNPYLPVFPDPFSKMGLTPTGSSPSNMHPKYQQWAQEREKLFKQSLAKLKVEVVKANALIREANVLAQEMGKQTEFSVTLQIPAANLSPNRKRGAFVSEPAILVKRKNRGSQVWSMEKFENKIIDMRDMYEERKEKGLPMMVDDNDEELVVRAGPEDDYEDLEPFESHFIHRTYLDEGPPMKGDPFYESQENHNLIGVANVFLEALFYDVKLDYHVPIVSQQGEVAGRLHIELCRVAGTLPERMSDDLSSESSGDSSRPNSFIEMDDETGVAIGSTIVCRVCIKEAKGLPPALSNFVFCQYTYWGYPEPIVVPPIVNPDTMQKKKTDGMSFRFDHKKEFTVHVTEEFMEHCLEGALSIEVWGHRSVGLPNTVGAWEIDQVQAKSRSIMDRWSELTRKIELWLEIHELSEQGEYTPVEVLPKPEVLTGGVFQLRQGHSRRVLVRVKPVQNSGTLPIICESITHLSIGCVCARSKLQKGLDSYQEEDLALLREKWSDALQKRREYLDHQLQKIMNKEEKTEADTERERSLIDQWVCLTEERNAVLVPAASSGIPGAPADWEAPSGMEEHIPVIFLDLNAEDMSTPNVKEGLQAAGMNSILPKEHGAKFYTLPFVKNSDKDVCAIVSWDSSIHDSVHLNRVTPNNERVYLILKVVIRLSHPASMELVLRKRICINVYKRQSITDKLKKKIGKAVWAPVTGSDYFQDNLIYSGITYEIVSNIPKASEELEDRESLAQIAASQNDQRTADGETYIEKYIKGVSAVESILTLDRLRQDVAIKELLASRGRPQTTMRKATSVPNIHNILSSPRGIDDSLRSDSTQDLRDKDRFGNMPKNFSVDSFRHSTSSGDIQKDNFFSKDTAGLPNKPGFSLASPKAGMSPQPKLSKPLTTLVEEQRECKPLLKRNPSEDSDEDEFAKLKEEQETLKKLAALPEPQPPTTKSPSQEDNSANSIDSDDFQEFQAFQGDTKDTANGAHGSNVANVANGAHKAEGSANGKEASGITHSSTNDSLADVPAKSFTPSMSSSGYGSQAVSTQTLSSEDSGSVRSMSIDDTPENGVQDKPKTDNHSLRAQGEKSDPKVQGENVVGEKSDPKVQGENAVGEKSDPKVQGENMVQAENVVGEKSDSKVHAENAVSEKSDSKVHAENVVAEITESKVQAESAVGEKSDSKVQAENSVKAPGDEDSTVVDDSKLTPPSAMPGLVDIMDTKVPSNLNSPIKPVATPQTEAPEPITADEVLEVSVTEANVSNSTQESTEEKLTATESKEECKEESKEGEESQSIEPDSNAQIAETKSEPPASDTTRTTTSSAPCVSDFYSENAMEELENLSDEGEPAAVDTEAKTEPPLTNHVVEEKVKPRKPLNNGTEDRTVRRRSWAEKDGRQPSIWEEPYKPGQTEVRLRKGGSIDVGRTGSVKSKIRTGDKQAVKSSPSPMKATYRPVSMPLEMLAMEEGELGSQDGSHEDLNNSDNEDAMSVCSFGSRADLHRLGEAAVPSWIQATEPVLVLFSQGGSKPGTIMFVGQTEFASGNWIGVELDQPEGKNDGSVKGVRYFKCRKRHGVFVRHDKIIMDKKRRSGAKLAKQSSLRRSTGNLVGGSPGRDTGRDTGRETGRDSGRDTGKDSPSYLKGTAASSSRKK